MACGSLSRCHCKLTAWRTSCTFRLQNEHARYSTPVDGCSQKRWKSLQAGPRNNTSGETSFPHVSSVQSSQVIGHRAKQKQADKEFFVDLLNSAATKRDAKAYLARLKNPAKVRTFPKPKPETPRSKVNLGNLFDRPRALDASPVFTQHDLKEASFEDQEMQHAALVKLSNAHEIAGVTLQGLGQTLSQLSRLAIAPCVLLEVDEKDDALTRKALASAAEKLASTLDTSHASGARILDGIFNIDKEGSISIPFGSLLRAPMKRRQIPVVLPVAFSEVEQSMKLISTNQALLAIVRHMNGIQHQRQGAGVTNPSLPTGLPADKEFSLDRIVVIDKTGGIPSEVSADGKHVFINLSQEYDPVMSELNNVGSEESIRHMANLTLLRNALEHLPSHSSGLMTTPQAASYSAETQESAAGLTVGTRRQKNTLIHNLLTDKPAYSSSLPKTRLSKTPQDAPHASAATFVKKGMPVTILPDPWTNPWTVERPRIKLTDSAIDLDRLVYLINDSFNRVLDVEKYLERVNNNMAGVIIAGDYEGGAILTWETPPGADPADLSRQVPYLDKFAVLKRSQGAGGVADIVFNAMVRTCFPQGVCWRSRKDNLVNKWYFERSSGTWKIPDMNWTMFWTTPNITRDGDIFRDYDSVCRSVRPTWLDTRKVED